MKIIEAFWEKRNLGVTCKEIVIEVPDSIQDLKNVIPNLENIGYVVFKVPSGRVDLLHFLTGNGYCFIETVIEVLLDIESYCIPQVFQCLDGIIHYRLFLPSEIGTLQKEIKQGIFLTDRIALDSHFGVDIAANRYFNWVKDEVEKGNSFYEILHKENPIGFFALKQVGKHSYNPFLAGMYVQKSNFGFGFSIVSKSVEEIKKRNGRILTGSISTNNIPSIRLYSQFHSIPKKITYVLVKHFG